ncbi:cuticle protein 65-like [Frankliniella occidentalis]|uniref:Cuticle protein 65-like n=1 Tax=Frankliniella occidentalis TaxID=133901 RepID=A0A6J1TSQ1_FRAOC|nr:cuticle protein 65-like [Frankliniella occidentalis]
MAGITHSLTARTQQQQQPDTHLEMNALIVLSALLAVASAGYVADHYGGGLGGYGGYGGYGGGYGGSYYGGALGYGHAAPLAYAAAPVVKTIAPVATSYQNSYQISKSAYPVHYASPAIVKAPIVAAAPLAVAAPAYGLGYGHGYGHEYSGLGYAGHGYSAGLGGLGYGHGYGSHYL